MKRTRPLRDARRILGAALLAASAASCGLFDSSSGGGGGLAAASAARAQAPGTDLVVRGRWLLYQASESRTGLFGTDFNLDGDRIDTVAAVIDMQAGAEYLPGNPNRTNGAIAVEDVFVLGDEVFLVADEDEDGFNWNANASTTDLVLLHWRATSPTPTVVATLDQRSPLSFALVDDRLYFVIEDDPATTLLAPGETTLRFVTEAAPTTPNVILDENPARTLRPLLMAESEGLLFLLLDEEFEGASLNADADMIDPFVLALADGTNPAAVVRNVGLAIRFDNDPVRAVSTGTSDWLVAFPVDEFDEGQNFNDPTRFPPTWQPTNCVGLEDADTVDTSLHFLHFASWVADPANNPPVNTGLVGRRSILALAGVGASPGFVATVTPEDEEGECSLNDDGDPVPGMTTGDRVFRYVEAVQPPGGATDIQVDPVVDPELIVALQFSIDVTEGVGDLNGRFVAVIDEAADGRDYNGQTAINADLLAWLDPFAATPEWVVNHGPNGAPVFAGTNWLDVPADRNGLALGDALLLTNFQESVFGLPINPRDSDQADTFASLARFDPTDANGDFDFTVFPAAAAQQFPFLAVLNDYVLFPLDEDADSRDWNGDGIQNDVVLAAGEIANPTNVFLLTTLRNNNTFYRDPKLTTDGQVGAAFLVEESFVGLDLNGDGDTNDRMVRWVVL